MANKTIIIGALVFVVLLGLYGAGVATGLLIGGDGNTNIENATGLPSGGGPVEEQTEVAPESEDEPAAEDTNDTIQGIPARQFNERNITSYMIEYINVARVNGSANVTTDSINTTANLTGGGGLDPLKTETTKADRLINMAEAHSDAMAREGVVAHEINNISTVDRYKQYRLYQRCEINVDNNYVLSPDSERFETIGRTVAGQEYTPSDKLAGWKNLPANATQTNSSTTNQTQFNANDKQVARALVIHWLATAEDTEPILSDEMSEVGVGVTVTRTGSVYATLNTCGK